MTDKSNLDRIDHIAITIKNIKESIDWYQKHFKCKVVYEDETWAYLEFGNIRLALVVASQHPSHIAFQVENAAKYGALTSHRDGTKSVYIHDPAGNTIEMVDKI
jgi:catechol 2,3-dioxygenase-like lactoylglutathione lyase family enzyme